MNWRGHIAASFVAYIFLVFVFQLPAPTSIAALVLLAFASILPDFDHPQSVIREVFSIIMGFFSVGALVLFLEFQPIIKIALSCIGGVLVYLGMKNIPLRHRGRDSLHQWSVCLLFVGLCALVFYLIGISLRFLPFLLVGYGVHLLTDKSV